MPSTTPGAHVFHPTNSQATTVSSPPNSPRSGSPTIEAPNPKDPDEEETLPASSGSRTSGHAPATPTRPTPTRNRTSQGAAALLDMSRNFANVGEALTAALAPPSAATMQLPPTPIRQTNAVAAILRLEKSWLNNLQIIAFIEILRKDKTAADIYLALTEDDVRKDWVSAQLETTGHLF